MLTGRIRTQVLAFVVIAVVGVTYVGARYAGLGRLFGDSTYETALTLPGAGGIFDNAEVTYRGVTVGRVGDLEPTRSGIRAVLRIDKSAPRIPADVDAVVTNRSAIGEQYVDLRPRSAGGPYLHDGSRLSGGDDSLPPRTEDVLRSAEDFAGSVPVDSLRTVVDEVYLATNGIGGSLRTLIDTSGDFARTADLNYQVTSDLIESSDTVLATQHESAASIAGFSRSLRLFSQSLVGSDADFRRLLASAPLAANEVNALFQQVGAPLGVVMSNLISTAQIFGSNARGVEDVLIRLPQAVSIGYAVTGKDGLDLGLTQTYFDPLPCTQGYGGTQLRSGLDTGKGRPFNRDAGCTASPRSGSDVRGPRSVESRTAGTPQVIDPRRVTTPRSLAGLMGG